LVGRQGSRLGIEQDGARGRRTLVDGEKKLRSRWHRIADRPLLNLTWDRSCASAVSHARQKKKARFAGLAESRFREVDTVRKVSA